MARPHGFDHFCSYLNGLEDQYVIIGGGAAAIMMDEQALDFRATRDVDLVVLSRSEELNARILSYIKNGLYKTKESTEKLPRYYRFRSPENNECPSVIEIFARNELGLELEEGQHIVPITDSTSERLSAILLDDEYFDLIRNNLIVSTSGIPLINAIANICLKARAHRELSERKTNGDTTVDSKDIQKHLKDIWRIAVTLTGEEVVSLSPTPAKDIADAVEKLDQIPDAQFAQVMERTPGTKKIDLMALLKKVFHYNN